MDFRFINRYLDNLKPARTGQTRETTTRQQYNRENREFGSFSELKMAGFIV